MQEAEPAVGAVVGGEQKHEDEGCCQQHAAYYYKDLQGFEQAAALAVFAARGFTFVVFFGHGVSIIKSDL